MYVINASRRQLHPATSFREGASQDVKLRDEQWEKGPVVASGHLLHEAGLGS